MKKWEKFKNIGNQKIPFLESFSYDGSEVIIQVIFENQIKTVKCDDVLSFKMIEEGNAFHTLQEQDFDGDTWIFRTNSSALIDWFNYESESIHSDQLTSYIIVTQDQFFEFLTHSEIDVT
jgi:hypothetical protein